MTGVTQEINKSGDMFYFGKTPQHQQRQQQMRCQSQWKSLGMIKKEELKKKEAQPRQRCNLEKSYQRMFSCRPSGSSSITMTASQNVSRKFYVRATSILQWTMVQVLLTLEISFITSRERLRLQIIRRINFTNLNSMAIRKLKFKAFLSLMKHTQRFNFLSSLNQ